MQNTSFAVFCVLASLYLYSMLFCCKSQQIFYSEGMLCCAVLLTICKSEEEVSKKLVVIPTSSNLGHPFNDFSSLPALIFCHGVKTPGLYGNHYLPNVQQKILITKRCYLLRKRSNYINMDDMDLCLFSPFFSVSLFGFV